MSTALYLGIGGILLIIIIIVAVMMMGKKDETKTEEKSDSSNGEDTGASGGTSSGGSSSGSSGAPIENNPSTAITSTETQLPLEPLIIKSTKTICAISNDNQLYCMDQNTNNNWIKVNAQNPRHIAIDDQTNVLYLVQSDGKLFSSKIPLDGKYDKLVWKQLNGTFKQIAANSDLVCGVNNNDDIYCGTADANGNITFTQVGGKLKQISVGLNKSIHGANSLDELYYASYPGGFNKNIGSGKQIDTINLERNCVVNSSNQLFCRLSGNWHHITPNRNFQYVTTNSNQEVVALDQFGKPQYNESFISGNPNWTELPTTSPSVPGKTITFKQIDF